MPPCARFAEPGNAGVGLDLDEEELADRDGVTAVIFMGAPIEGLVSRLQPEQHPLGVVGEQIDEAVRPLAHVADALLQVFEHAFLHHRLAARDLEPHQSSPESAPAKKLPCQAGKRSAS